MKTTVKLKWLVLLICGVLCASFFASCGDDDESTPDKNSKSLVGTWRKVFAHGIEFSFNGAGVNWVFKSDGTMQEHDIDDNGNIIPNRTEYFKYKTENGHLYTLELEEHDDGSMDDWKDEGAYTINGNILEITEEDGDIRRLQRVSK